MGTKPTGKRLKAAGLYSDEMSRHVPNVIDKSTKKNLRRHALSKTRNGSHFNTSQNERHLSKPVL